MIETAFYEDLMQVRLSREMNGQALYWTAAYLVDGLLIDSGCAYTSDELVRFIEGKEIHTLVNTHFHEDHCGGNRVVLERFDVPLYAHRDSIPYIAMRPHLYPYQEIAWGYPEPTEAEPIPDVLETEHYRFEVVDTPGHSLGHICLVEQSRGWCFSGDIFAREGMKFIRPEEDMKATVASMQSLIDLPCERLVLLTSLGRIIEDGRVALASCIENLERLADQVESLHRRGFSQESIMQEIFGGEHPFCELTNNQYSTRNLVRSLLQMRQQGTDNPPR